MLTVDFWPLFIGITGGLILVLVLVLGIFIYRFKKKSQTPLVEPEFIKNLIEALGSNVNIADVTLQSGRLCIELLDVNQADFTALKVLANGGFFITKNTIKILFHEKSETIFKALKASIKGEIK